MEREEGQGRGRTWPLQT